MQFKYMCTFGIQFGPQMSHLPVPAPSLVALIENVGIYKSIKRCQYENNQNSSILV